MSAHPPSAFVSSPMFASTWRTDPRMSPARAASPTILPLAGVSGSKCQMSAVRPRIAIAARDHTEMRSAKTTATGADSTTVTAIVQPCDGRSAEMRSLLSFVIEYRVAYLVLFLFLIATAVLEGLGLAVLYPLLAAILSAPPTSAGPLLDLLLRTADGLAGGDRLIGAFALFIIIVPLSSLGKLGREWLQARTSAATTWDVKRRVFERLRTRPYSYFITRREGDLTYRLTVAPQNLAAALLFATISVSYSLTGLATFLLLVTIEWRTTLAMLALGIVFFGANRFVARRFSYNAGREKMSAQSAELGVAHELLGGIRDIAAADASRAWLQRFLVQSKTYRRYFVRDLTWSAVPGLFLELAVLILAAVSAAVIHLAAPDLLVSLLPVLAVYVYATRSLLGTVGLVSRQLLRIAALEPDVALLRGALSEPADPRGELQPSRPVPAWERIAIRDLSFVYPQRDVAVLEGLSLTIERGRTTALVGASGSGKSTILLLLLGLLGPSSGRIMVGDTDLSDVDRAQWLSRVGYVGQEPFVFNGTVAENIAFGEDRPTPTIVDAARAAQADGFIDALPRGYDTMVGDRGVTLSAGQRQRLVIARALVRRPDLLLLDEATSALDSVSEELFQRALASISRRTTVVVVAHRLSTVRQADMIVVLEHGRVAESGRHERLMAAGGVYARLVRSFEEPVPAVG